MIWADADLFLGWEHQVWNYLLRCDWCSCIANCFPILFSYDEIQLFWVVSGAGYHFFMIDYFDLVVVSRMAVFIYLRNWFWPARAARYENWWRNSRRMPTVWERSWCLGAQAGFDGRLVECLFQSFDSACQVQGIPEFSVVIVATIFCVNIDLVLFWDHTLGVEDSILDILDLKALLWSLRALGSQSLIFFCWFHWKNWSQSWNTLSYSTCQTPIARQLFCSRRWISTSGVYGIPFVSNRITLFLKLRHQVALNPIIDYPVSSFNFDFLFHPQRPFSIQRADGLIRRCHDNEGWLEWWTLAVWSVLFFLRGKFLFWCWWRNQMRISF